MEKQTYIDSWVSILIKWLFSREISNVQINFNCDSNLGIFENTLFVGQFVNMYGSFFYLVS